MTVTLKNGEKLEFDGSLFVRSLSYDLTVNYLIWFRLSHGVRGWVDSLHAYTQSGLPQLNQWLRDLQIHEHAPPRKDFDLTVGPGSQDLLAKVKMDMLRNRFATVIFWHVKNGNI